jgi:sugar lactone lactonase YvrE
MLWYFGIDWCNIFSLQMPQRKKNEDILIIPCGITVDENGNLYVVGERTSNTVVISADGQYQKQILAKEDGLNNPSAVCFDEPKRKHYT